MQTKNVVIFGDSILRGVIAKHNRYALGRHINWAMIESELNVKIVNNSRMGAGIIDGFKRINDFFNSGKSADIIVVEYGGNDCDYDWKYVSQNKSREHHPKTSPEEFDNYLAKTIALIQSKNVKPVLISLPPIYASGYYNHISKGLNEDNLMYFLGDIETIYRHQEYYNNIIMATAQKFGVDLVDVRKSFLINPDYKNLMCSDGIHPNERGGQLIVDEFLKKYRRFPSAAVSADGFSLIREFVLLNNRQ